jgi:outer membrane protein OmpA-like peptidoglycan-associated protein
MGAVGRTDSARRRTLAGLALCLGAVLASSSAAHEFRPTGWQLPDLYGAERVSEEMYNFDLRVPGNETRLEQFYTTDGGRVLRYSHRGHIFAYSVDNDRKGPMDFTLVDFNGSGLFEVKQSPYDEYPLPLWTMRPYLYPDVAMGIAAPPVDLTGKAPNSADLIKALGQETGSGRVALSIQFDFDQDTLRPEAVSTLSALGKAMTSKELTPSRFLIEGHTDSKGSFQYNQDLSDRRARTVQKYLEREFSIPISRLDTVGKGESQPLPGTAPEDGRNRRVEIVNLGSGASLTEKKTK